MARQNVLRLGMVVVTALALTLVGSTGAIAQPTNDDFAGATVVDTLPFTTNEDTSDATWDPSDPWNCSSNGSVWFAFTPSSDMAVSANTFGSSYDTVLSAWTGSQGSLNPLACNDDANGTAQSQIAFPVVARR